MLGGRVFAWLKRARRDDLADYMPTPENYPTEAELNKDPDFNRHFATMVWGQLASASRLSIRISADVSKWLLTSLLAVTVLFSRPAIAKV